MSAVTAVQDSGDKATEALKALLDRASPAPWVQEDECSDIIKCPLYTVAETIDSPDDAAFIAAARNHVPVLLDLLADRDAELEQLRAQIEQYEEASSREPQLTIAAQTAEIGRLARANSGQRDELVKLRAELDRLKAILRHPVVASVVALAEEAERQYRRAEAAHDLKDEANQRWLDAATAAGESGGTDG